MFQFTAAAHSPAALQIMLRNLTLGASLFQVRVFAYSGLHIGGGKGTVSAPPTPAPGL